jgi:localization factor PodJL
MEISKGGTAAGASTTGDVADIERSAPVPPDMAARNTPEVSGPAAVPPSRGDGVVASAPQKTAAAQEPRAELPGSREISPRRAFAPAAASPADSRDQGRVFGEERRPAGPAIDIAASSRMADAPFIRRPAPRTGADLQSEIGQYFISLQDNLKKAIAQDVAREISSLRAEIRKSDAEDRHYAANTREDLANLADSIVQLSRRNDDDVAALSPKIAEIRLLMDGLATDVSLQGIEACWERIDSELQAAGATRDVLAALTDQFQGLRQQLDDKLASIATATQETAASAPVGRELVELISALTARLETLGRIVSANGRGSLSATDTTMIQRLENRICSLSDKVDLMSSEATLRHQPTYDLAAKIDRLAERVEQMATADESANLDERFEALARQIDRVQKNAPQLEITRHLAAIAKKIDAVGPIGGDDGLAEKLDYLARRMDEIDLGPTGAKQVFDEAMVKRLDVRLADISDRLAFSVVSFSGMEPNGEIEHQMRRLTALLGEAWGDLGAFPAEFDRRMTALEAFVTSNDEFIVEAAQKAAEAVIHANAFDNEPAETTSAVIKPALAAMAEDLQLLENAGRAASERTHRTFEALHDTLIQIADRLMLMDERISATIENKQNMSAEMLEEVIKAELVAALSQEKPKQGLLAGLSRRFTPAG